jgi:hypothetical protein
MNKISRKDIVNLLNSFDINPDFCLFQKISHWEVPAYCIKIEAPTFKQAETILEIISPSFTPFLSHYRVEKALYKSYWEIKGTSYYNERGQKMADPSRYILEFYVNTN